MKRNALKLAALLFLLHPVLVPAGESETGPTDKIYRDYTEAYQKTVQAYEQSAQAKKIGTYLTYVTVGAFCLFCFMLLRWQKTQNERSVQVGLRSLQLLEEIRDLLKNGRT